MLRYIKEDALVSMLYIFCMPEWGHRAWKDKKNIGKSDGKILEYKEYEHFA